METFNSWLIPKLASFCKQKMDNCISVCSWLGPLVLATFHAPFIRIYFSAELETAGEENGLYVILHFTFLTLTLSWWLLKSWHRLNAFITGSLWSSTMLWVVMGGKLEAPWAKMHRLSFTKSFLDKRSVGSGTAPLRHVSYSLTPISFWISSMVSLRPLATAWPRRDSTLKLLVLVGKMRKATTVLSDLLSFNCNNNTLVLKFLKNSNYSF